jgi:hypothetical protein
VRIIKRFSTLPSNSWSIPQREGRVTILTEKETICATLALWLPSYDHPLPPLILFSPSRELVLYFRQLPNDHTLSDTYTYSVPQRRAWAYVVVVVLPPPLLRQHLPLCPPSTSLAVRATPLILTPPFQPNPSMLSPASSSPSCSRSRSSTGKRSTSSVTRLASAAVALATATTVSAAGKAGTFEIVGNSGVSAQQVSSSSPPVCHLSYVGRKRGPRQRVLCFGVVRACG